MVCELIQAPLAMCVGAAPGVCPRGGWPTMTKAPSVKSPPQTTPGKITECSESITRGYSLAGPWLPLVHGYESTLGPPPKSTRHNGRAEVRLTAARRCAHIPGNGQSLL